MKRHFTLMLIAALAVLGAITLWLPLDQEAQSPVIRLASHFRSFDADPNSYPHYTDATYGPPYRYSSTSYPYVDGGIAVFQKTVFVPTSVNTLYITVAGTGTGHSGAGHWFSCNIDRGLANQKFCQSAGTFVPGDQGSSNITYPGWIALQQHGSSHYHRSYDYGFGYSNTSSVGADDFHSNAITYTWCTSILPGTHTVELRMASNSGNLVAMSGAHFFIDGSFIRNLQGCTQGTPANRRFGD